MIRLYPSVPDGIYPANDFPDYRSSEKRAPLKPAIAIPHTTSEITGPRFGREKLREGAQDLTRQVPRGTPQGQRIIVFGRVTDDRGRPDRGALIEVWQANAAGRYRHDSDTHDAPLDPYFIGAGQVVTDDEGYYEFTTIEPGAYPWPNHYNAWRPKHIHFSLFGPAWATRLVTQMYFPGDPTLPLDPIFMGTSDESARKRMISVFDIERSVPDHAMAYRFDIGIRGADEMPWEVDA